MLEHRKDGRQRDRAARPVQLESDAPRRRGDRLVEVDGEVVVGVERLEPQDVGHGVAWKDVLLVRRGEGGRVLAREPVAGVFTELVDELVGERVRP